MNGDLIARKYARGLFDAGRSADVLEPLYDEAESLLAYLRHDRQLLAFLTAPQVKDEDKESVVRDSFTSRVSETFLSFLLLLVTKHRIDHLDGILDHFIGLVKDHQGILPTRVVTAFPLSGADRDRLTAQLAARTGKEIELTVVEDASLIGGIIVIVGNQIMDYSVRHYLGELKSRLLALKV